MGLTCRTERGRATSHSKAQTCQAGHIESGVALGVILLGDP